MWWRHELFQESGDNERGRNEPSLFASRPRSTTVLFRRLVPGQRNVDALVHQSFQSLVVEQQHSQNVWRLLCVDVTDLLRILHCIHPPLNFRLCITNWPTAVNLGSVRFECWPGRHLFCGYLSFSHFLQVNAGTLPQIRRRPLPSTSLPIHSLQSSCRSTLLSVSYWKHLQIIHRYIQI
jgi:hypothetical protein